MHSANTMVGNIGHELKVHVPFTLAGTLAGVVLLLVMVWTNVPQHWSENLFWISHPAHVFLSAVATAGMYRSHGRGGILGTIVVGYVGCIGISTLSDCVIPYVAENLLGLHSHVHAGFIEMWWLVNPLAAAGIAVACWRPKTRISHAGHVLLSTWASLFHTTMVLDGQFSAVTLMVISAFLFIAVWIPCGTSDIVFPLLFAREEVGIHARR